MGNRVTEKCLFEAFLNAMPDFAREAIQNWQQPVQDPPDILCTTVSGRQIGVELGEWLIQSQISEGRGLESIQNSLLQVIGPQPENQCRNIYTVWLYPRWRARVKPEDGPSFRQELFALVTNTDTTWEREPGGQSPQGRYAKDLMSYPTLRKYLQKVHFQPRGYNTDCEASPTGPRPAMLASPKGCDWITFRPRVGACSPEPMLDALRSILHKKIQKYTVKPPQVSMDEFYLLIHYNQALWYNTPVETPEFNFDNAAHAATEFIGGRRRSARMTHLCSAKVTHTKNRIWRSASACQHYHPRRRRVSLSFREGDRRGEPAQTPGAAFGAGQNRCLSSSRGSLFASKPW